MRFLPSGGRAAGRLAIWLLVGASLAVSLAACAVADPYYGPVPTPSFVSPVPVTAGPVLTSTFAAPPSPSPATDTPPLDDTATATLGVLPTSGPTMTPPATPAATNTQGAPCADQACASAAVHFWLQRPIPSRPGFVNYVDRSYPYGSTQGGQRAPHHGVEFFNNQGTPIVAAAAGRVVVAGQDDDIAYGPATHFYGKLVVIQLDQAYQGQPVFNLYGHMFSLRVRQGDHVAAGDQLGTVGQTGVAIGPHLHFEVRVGQNAYSATRNPELWLMPLPENGKPSGAIAGRVTDLDGNLLPEVTVVIRPIATTSKQPRNRYINTYATDPFLINGDDRLQENFAIGDMPPGLYSISVSMGKFVQQLLTVGPNQVAWITFAVKPLPVSPSGTPPTPSDTPPAGPTGSPGAVITATVTPASTP
jgi:murein DD-endopeptidase MepM/ murein hydrolase activator NlpD